MALSHMPCPQAQQLALCLDSSIPGEMHRALNTLSALSSDPLTPLSLQPPHASALLPPLLRVLAGADDVPSEGYAFAVHAPTTKPGPARLVRWRRVLVRRVLVRTAYSSLPIAVATTTTAMLCLSSVIAYSHSMHMLAMHATPSSQVAEPPSPPVDEHERFACACAAAAILRNLALHPSNHDALYAADTSAHLTAALHAALQVHTR